MKLIYQINSLYNPGGMERVVLNKATWLSAHGWEVVIVTTDQGGRPTFYNFPEQIRLHDLGINYSADKGKNIVAHIFSYLKKKQLHKKRLTEFLMAEKADIVDTLYPGESSFIPSIKDGSKKVIELHQSKFFHRQYANKGLKGLIDRFREIMDVRMVKKFDRFVVLTEEDKGYWGDIANMVAIPNSSIAPSGSGSDCSAKRVIAIGRLDYQKSFDRLIQAWKIVCDNSREWELDIYGQGEWKDMLQGMIDQYGIADRCHLRGTTNDISHEYANSSMLVMSSHYEGLPMVMIEAMSSGLPCVSFDFKCGPRDIIDDGVNGLLVKDGDIEGLAEAMLKLINDDELRSSMSVEARKVIGKYNEESVMEKWIKLYSELTGRE